jgi:hypothetical protein
MPKLSNVGATCEELFVDIMQALKHKHKDKDTVVYLEQVGGYVGGGGQPGSAMFKFGQNFGMCLTVPRALGMKVITYTPQQWQKPLGIGTVRTAGGKTPWKNKLKAAAQALYPKVKVTLSTADALLILNYGHTHNATAIIRN